MPYDSLSCGMGEERCFWRRKVMKTLYEAYLEIVGDEDILHSLLEFDSDKESGRKIKGIFKNQGKDRCFEHLENSSIELTRSFHSVSLYLLGLHLIGESRFFEQFKNFKHSLSDNYKFTTFPEVKKYCDDKNINTVAAYIWALASLYHDVATSREKLKQPLSESVIRNALPENYLSSCDVFGKKPINYTIFENYKEIDDILKNCSRNNCNGIPTYSDEIINGYFRKRLKDGCIDHGVASGYLFYDALVKNYIKNKEKVVSVNEQGEFSVNELKFRPVHLQLFKYIADAIIVHNIWRYNDKTKSEYDSYGIAIESLQEEKNLFTVEDNPLPFFLCLVDTIEPTKFFYQLSFESVLKGISIDCFGDRIEIQVNKTENFPLSQTIIKEWFSNKLSSMSKWLNVKVHEDKSVEYKIVITTKL